MSKPDNPPAFARSAATVKTWEGMNGDETEVTYDAYEGMSLRDYFAAKAMQRMVDGLVADEAAETLEQLARDAYAVADAMLVVRAEAK